MFSFFKKKPTVVVHDGKFHCDDIFAVATLELVHGEMNIIRTRDQSIIEKADYVADVGGIYDSEKNRFDHHQKGGAGFRENGVPYAAFGLVWKKYGEQLCGSKQAAMLIDERLILPLDADDVAFPLGEFTGQFAPVIFQGYFYAFRPSWKEDQKMYDENFVMLVGRAVEFLKREIIRTNDLLEASTEVKKAYESAIDKRVVVLERNYPYNDELQKYPEPLFVVTYRPNGSWGLNTITAEDKGRFDIRKKLPETWAGLRDEEMAKVSGVPDAVFCHNGRFLAVAKTKEGALALAQKALEN